MMQIAVKLGLPWVLRMDGNPLGIDCRLEKQQIGVFSVSLLYE